MAELTLDHVIIGVEDLGRGAAELSRVLGRRPSWRGRHPTYGTANVLFRLDNAYLELLAPDPEAAAGAAGSRAGQAWAGSLGRFLISRGGGLFSIALQTADVFAAAERARSRGLPVEEPLPGSGIDLDTGARREWVNARIPPEATRGARCFFIEHRSPADALPPAPLDAPAATAAASVAAVVTGSREVEGARRMWREVFGLREEPASGGWRFDLGNATLFLQETPSAASAQEGGEGQPDSWLALVLTVGDMDGAAARLRGAGIAVEPAEAAGFAGIALDACGARLLLTETA
jgi:hypothetical protein